MTNNIGLFLNDFIHKYYVGKVYYFEKGKSLLKTVYRRKISELISNNTYKLNRWYGMNWK